MANVRIRAGKGVDAVASIEIDGIDVSHHVLAEGFRVELPTDPDGVAEIHCILVAESLDLDLPGGSALRGVAQDGGADHG